MLNLAWSNGVKAIRSTQEDNPYLKKSTTAEKIDTAVNHNREVFPQEEIQSRVQVEGDYSLSRDTYRKTSNRRETSNSKLSERGMVSRACGNSVFNTFKLYG